MTKAIYGEFHQHEEDGLLVVDPCCQEDYQALLRNNRDDMERC